MGKKYDFPSDLKKDAESIKQSTKKAENTVNGLPLDLNENEAVKANSTKNVKTILTEDPKFKDKFGWNSFKEKVELLDDIPDLLIKKGEFKDLYRDMIGGYIEEHYHTLFKRDIFISGLKQAAVKQIFNPVTDRIKEVKWDGEPRVDTFFIDFLGTKDNEYIRQVTRKWLVGAIARAFEPGIKFEMVPVLTGDQGLGKSTLCGALNPAYFVDELPSLSGSNKETLLKIHDSWIIEVAELAAMNKTTLESTKAFISTKSDKYRAPYGTAMEDHARRCVFIGSTNEPEFLKDKTGNRRFLPIDCGLEEPTKDVFDIKKDYILQVLAEAYQYYQAGEKIFLDKKMNEELKKVQQNNFIEDPLEDTIEEYLEMPVPTDWDDYSIFQRRSYFDKYKDTGELRDRKAVLIPDNRLVNMSKVASKELLQVVLNVQNRDLASASRGAFGKKISLIMNGFDNWERKGAIRFQGKNANGWRKDPTN